MYKHIKRLFDIIISLLSLIFFSPLIIIVTIWLYFANKGAGSFFWHARAGKDNRIFHVVKFKTMTDERDSDWNLLPDGQRLTKVGRFIRSTSIDELPQLWNVLKGDMSIIGPRPLYDFFVPLYSEYHRRRHEVRPGITGWAQVHGRNLLVYSKKFDFDVWYVDHISFSLDMKILAMTIRSVFKRENVGEGEEDDAIVDDLGFGKRIDEMKERGEI